MTESRRVRNILIVKRAALGDVLRTTALLPALRRRYPHGRITWMTAVSAVPLLKGNPWIDEISVPRVGEKCRHVAYDLVLSMEEDLAFAARARARCRGRLVGVFARAGRLRYTRSSAPYYAMSLLNRDRNGGLQAANRLKSRNRRTYAQLWRTILNLPVAGDRRKDFPELWLGSKDRDAARALVARYRLGSKPRPIGLNPGAGRRWPAKQLSEAKAVELVRLFHRDFRRPVLLFGGREEALRNRRILRRTRALAIDAGTNLPLRAFAGVIDLCAVVVTTDSLALHIAVALGKKTVVLVGPTSPTELDIRPGDYKITPPGGCDCFYQACCTRSTGDERAFPAGQRVSRGRDCADCLDLVPAGQVAAAVRQGLLR